MRRCLATILVAVTSAAAMAVAPGPAGAHDPYGSLLAEVKRIAAKYHNIDRAIRDGYLPTDVCVSVPGAGMGYHYVKPDLFDGTADPLRPEAILYVPSGRGRRLAGIEYLTVDADQDLTTADDRPELFGIPFDGPMEGHEPGMPIHYDLHVWLFKRNPDGLFAPFNPRVSCP